MAGQKISEQSKPKMCGLPYDLLDKLIKDMPQALDYVIIEADGAKHHSLKYPAADEPVIYPLTTDVIIVLGTWEKGKLCKDVVFRYELMQNELGMAEDVVVDDSVIDTLRQVYVKKLRDSGFKGHLTPYGCRIVCLKSYHQMSCTVQSVDDACRRSPAPRHMINKFFFFI